MFVHNKVWGEPQNHLLRFTLYNFKVINSYLLSNFDDTWTQEYVYFITTLGLISCSLYFPFRFRFSIFSSLWLFFLLITWLNWNIYNVIIYVIILYIGSVQLTFTDWKEQFKIDFDSFENFESSSYNSFCNGIWRKIAWTQVDLFWRVIV